MICISVSLCIISPPSLSLLFAAASIFKHIGEVEVPKKGDIVACSSSCLLSVVFIQ
jgi:hypothetical protein